MNPTAQSYRRNQILTAAPEQILVVMLDGAVRFTQQGLDAIEAGDAAKKGVALGRTISIIAELISSLDHDSAPELCENLEGLYIYFIDQLRRGSLRMEAAPVAEVLRHLHQLRASWTEAIEIIRAEARP